MTNPGSTLEFTDEELISKVSAKDEDAFKELYSRYNLSIFNYLLRLVKQATSAEDLLQEAFLAIWQGADKFRGQSSVKTWVFRIAHHKAISWLRKHGGVQQIPHDIDELSLFSQEISPEEALIQNGQIAQIQKALEQLSSNHRSTVELAFVYGFSYNEIAEIMRCPLGTVKSRMNYALKYINSDLTASALAQKGSR